MDELKNIDNIENQQNLDKSEDKKSNFIKKLWDILWFPIFTFIIVFVIFKMVLFHGYVPSASMDKTILAKSWILGERVSVQLDKSNIKRYDVVVFYAELHPGQPEHVVKRVIGLPGDNVKITKDAIYINGEKAKDEFVSSIDITQEEDTFTVPENSYFVCGDNRANSFDSRKWSHKFVDANSIVAKVWANYWFWGFDILDKY